MLDIRDKKIVITRKVHTCFACTEEIEKGKSAVYVAAKEDEQRRNFHLHEKCNKIIAKDKWFSGSGLYYGCLKDVKSIEETDSLLLTQDEELPFVRY